TLKPAVRQIAKQQRLLREARAPLVFVYSRVHVTVGNEHIQPTVIIKIYEVRAPPQEWNRRLAVSGLEGDIREIAVAIVVIERIRVIRKVRDVHVQLAIIIVIANRQTHPSLLLAVFVER